MAKWKVRLKQKEKFSDDGASYSVKTLHNIPGNTAYEAMRAVAKEYYDATIIEVKLEKGTDWSEVRNNMALLGH